MSDEGFASGWIDGWAFRIWKADQVVGRAVMNAVEGIGATVTQIGIVVHLDEMGPMSASDLARLLHLTPQSTTAALAHLEALGWTRRSPHPTHRRVLLHDVTAAGRDAAASGRHRVAVVDRDVDDALTPTQRDALRRAVDAIIDA